MAERVAVMRRVWAGEKVTESVAAGRTAAASAGRAGLLVGTMGPKTVRSAAAWADGLAGMSWIWTSPSRASCSTSRGRRGRRPGKPKPHLATSFWFAIGDGDDARAQVHRHLRRYMNWIPARLRRRDGTDHRVGR